MLKGNNSFLSIIISKIKISIFNALSFARRLFCCSPTPIGAIIMLHRVDAPEENGIWYNQHLKMSPGTIEDMVRYAWSHKCKFISLDEMTEVIRKKKRKRRLIILTLDDGYQDNYQYGYPVFRKLGIPYTIYICTKMVKSEMLFWWDILEQLVLKQNQVILSDGRSFDCSTKAKKEQSFLDIREIILKLPQDNLKLRLQALFVKYEINWEYGNDFLGLSWEQLGELKNDPFATIGNHSYSHKAFTGLTDDEIKVDINKAASEMRVNTGIEMSHFAFPFGEATAVSQHDVELVKELGFKTSATTNDGFVCYGTDLLELPRFFVTERNWKQVIDQVIMNC